ncbi:hypothetical protein [Paraeggerthella sp.]|uniref:hypothetical protein n=1 Tax=Paraeggerthella sp. TaxID=2897350 RepID=UPI0035286569
MPAFDEAIQIVLAVVLSTLGGAVFLWVIDVRLPIRVFFVACFLLIFFMGGIRFPLPRHAAERPRTRLGAAHVPIAPGRAWWAQARPALWPSAAMASMDPLMPGIPLVATDDDRSKRGSRHPWREGGGHYRRHRCAG